MSRSLLGLSKTLSVMSAAVIGSWLASPLAALALPEAEILEKLQNVPTFSIINAEGQVLPLQVATQGNEPSNEPLPWFFINPQDAITALDEISKDQPEIKSEWKVLPVPLSRVYEILKGSEEQNSEKPPFAILPYIPEIQAAIAIREANGQEVQNPSDVGIPLFFAIIAEGDESTRFMTLTPQGEDTVIPFFWRKEQVEQIISVYEEQVPEAKDQSIQIQSISLEQFIQKLRNEDSEAAKIMRIFPTQEQIQIANQLIESAAQNQ